MAGKAASASQRKREKRPRLTHFLCLPLVNSTSLPQLETSLASFKASIPRAPPKDLASRAEDNHTDGRRLSDSTDALVPDAALRPVGTLHLTLGVMSLPTTERLKQAIEFLHSLDLVAILREAEDVANSRQKKRYQKAHPSDTSAVTGTEADSRNSLPQPFNISLESLHAFPRARSATVLHAAPVDPTARLYPFCVLLRDKFIEAGFVLPDYKPEKSNRATETPQQTQEYITQQPTTSASDGQVEATAVESPAERQAILEELPHLEASELPQTTIAAEHRSPRIPKQRKPKLRPLVLHCTIANTIYIKGRGRGNNGDGVAKPNGRNYKRNNHGNQRYSFDARNILSHYRDFYVDGERTQPRLSNISTDNVDEPCNQENDSISEASSSSSSSDLSIPIEVGAENDSACDQSRAPDKGRDKKRKREDGKDGSAATSYPFVWARNFPLEKVCICEMGAKKLDADDHDGLGARLGEEYHEVAERSLLFDTLPECVENDDDGGGLVAGEGSETSTDGGVAVPHPPMSDLAR